MNKPRRDNYIYFTLLWPIYMNHQRIVFPVFRDYMVSSDRLKCSVEQLFQHSYAEPIYNLLMGNVGTRKERKGLNLGMSRGPESTEAPTQNEELGEAIMSNELSIGFELWAFQPRGGVIWGKWTHLAKRQRLNWHWALAHLNTVNLLPCGARVTILYNRRCGSLRTVPSQRTEAIFT